MTQVQLTIDATHSNYSACLDTDHEGQRHEKRIQKDKEATVHANLLRAAIEGFRALNRPCMVDVYTRSEYVVEPFRNGWIGNWEKHGWKNAKGKEVRNAELWKELRKVTAPHSVRYLYQSEGNK